MYVFMFARGLLETHDTSRLGLFSMRSSINRKLAILL